MCQIQGPVLNFMLHKSDLLLETVVLWVKFSSPMDLRGSGTSRPEKAENNPDILGYSGQKATVSRREYPETPPECIIHPF